MKNEIKHLRISLLFVTILYVFLSVYHHQTSLAHMVDVCESRGQKYMAYWNHLKNHYSHGCETRIGTGNIVLLDMTIERAN